MNFRGVALKARGIIVFAAGLDLFRRRLPVWARCLVLLLIALVPSAYVAKQYVLRHDLTQMIFFGTTFQASEVPALKEMHPYLDPQSGYDGQFYAQMSLDPTLRNPHLNEAIDEPNYREQRIILPLMAYILGGGRPAAVIVTYALLNLLFWFVLLGALVYWMKAKSPRDFLAVAAIVLTSGALVSIERSLTDLPAATLGALGLMAGESHAVVFIAAAILTKPTSGLFLLRYGTVPWPRGLGGWGRRAGLVVLALIPPASWIFYLHRLHGSDSGTLVWPFDLPVRGLVDRGIIFWNSLREAPFVLSLRSMSEFEWRLFQELTLVSLAVQAVYLLVRPRWNDVFWAAGAGFAVMYLCLSSGELVEELNFCRTVLALTVCFNLVLWKYGRGWWHAFFFVLGNFGLLLHFHGMAIFLTHEVTL